jgi:RNA polymerase sigma factor (sigma-70 family)
MPPARDNPQESVRPERPLPEELGPFLHRLFAASGAERWRLPFTVFVTALERSAAKRFPETWPAPAELEEYLGALYSKDLALASACAEASDDAWEEFVLSYRSYLRLAAAAILRCPPSDPAAGDLADSLFSDLFGLRENSAGNARGRSLFRYFHGRSSLKTWLRAILAQRHIDQIRSGRKLDSLDEPPRDGESRRFPEPAVAALAPDPRRIEYVERFREALAAALAALDPRDRLRLQLYYVEERTLAQIGREIGEHESSVSRNLERVRRELRTTVEGLLRTRRAAGNGLSAPALDDAQVALCIEYAAEDAAIDLDKLFAAQKLQDAPGPNPRIKP